MKTRKSKPKARTLSYDALVGTLSLTVDGRDAGTYWLDRLACDLGGVAVRLTPFTACRRADQPACYDVRVAKDGRSCECMGFLRHGHCKHGDALAALVAAGRIA